MQYLQFLFQWWFPAFYFVSPVTGDGTQALLDARPLVYIYSPVFYFGCWTHSCSDWPWAHTSPRWAAVVRPGSSTDLDSLFDKRPVQIRLSFLIICWEPSTVLNALHYYFILSTRTLGYILWSFNKALHLSESSEFSGVFEMMGDYCFIKIYLYSFVIICTYVCLCEDMYMVSIGDPWVEQSCRVPWSWSSPGGYKLACVGAEHWTWVLWKGSMLS